MTELKGCQMQLSRSERHWLPWIGTNSMLRLGWSCFLNRNAYSIVEEVFEGIAATRVHLLQQWTSSHWKQLQELAALCSSADIDLWARLLERRVIQLPDCSELRGRI